MREFGLGRLTAGEEEDLTQLQALTNAVRCDGAAVVERWLARQVVMGRLLQGESARAGQLKGLVEARAHAHVHAAEQQHCPALQSRVTRKGRLRVSLILYIHHGWR